MANSTSSTASLSNSDSLTDSDDTWASRFHNRPENSVLIIIHDNFIQDKFNLVDLIKYIPGLAKSYNEIINKTPRKIGKKKHFCTI